MSPVAYLTCLMIIFLIDTQVSKLNKLYSITFYFCVNKRFFFTQLPSKQQYSSQINSMLFYHSRSR